MKNACTCEPLLNCEQAVNPDPAIQHAIKPERLLLSQKTRTKTTPHPSVTQTQVWAEFEKSRTLLDGRTFEADCNVHCPCRLLSLRILVVHPDPLQAIPQRTIHPLRRNTTLSTRTIAPRPRRVSKKLYDSGRLCLDTKGTWNHAGRLSFPEMAIRLLWNA